MEKSHKKFIYTYVLLSWILTILALVFRILARVYAYDTDVGYFKSNSLFPVLHRVSLLLLALLAGSSFLLFRKSSVPEAILPRMKQTCVMERIAAVVGGITMLFVSIYTVLFYYVSGTLAPTAFTILGLLTAFISVFFFLLFWIPTRVGGKAHIFSGCSLILHFVYILVSTYLELYTPMNNPVKMLLQITAVTAILYLLCDLRFYLEIARPTRYIACATLFLGVAVVSTLSYGLFGVLTEEHTQLYRLYSLTCFALLLPAAVRLIRFFMLWLEYERTQSEVKDSELPPTEDAPLASDNSDVQSTANDSTVAESCNIEIEEVSAYNESEDKSE